MTALTTRDALAKALHGRFSDFALLVTWDELTEAQRGTWLDDADALIASGVVVDAATLADDVFGDVSLIVARGIEGETASAVNGWGADLVRVERCYSHGIARAALTALAASLSERSSR